MLWAGSHLARRAAPFDTRQTCSLWSRAGHRVGSSPRERRLGRSLGVHPLFPLESQGLPERDSAQTQGSNRVAQSSSWSAGRGTALMALPSCWKRALQCPSSRPFTKDLDDQSKIWSSPFYDNILPAQMPNIFVWEIRKDNGSSQERRGRWREHNLRRLRQ